MSEITRYEAPEVFSVTRWDAYVEDETFGVPSEIVNDVCKALLKTVEHMGLDANELLFSGYDKDYPKEHGVFGEDTQLHQEIAWAKGAIKVFEAGKSSHEYASKEVALKELERLEAKKALADPQKHTYFFRTVGEFALENSPFDFAGTTDGAAIGVYSIEKLQELSDRYDGRFGLENFDHTVTLRREQLAEALVFVFRPRYNQIVTC